ncbi:MAG TPA: DUF2314 domain-containing protein [Anaerolineales bacterium]|nr:DUF2314 domain-containing protein [Anaerolineales bacterium]
MYRPLQWKALIILGLLLTVSCAPSTSAPAAGTPDPDPEHTAAVNKAHETMDTLFKALLAPQPSYTFVGVRVRFTGVERYEDMWTEPVDYYNGVFTVEMVEGVTVEHGLHPGRFVQVPVQDVLDWMILEEDGTVLGGYTIRLAYERMTPEEKEEFLRVTGYVME